MAQHILPANDIPSANAGATRVYQIDANMPWPEIFKVTWKFAVAAFAIWVALSIPLAILGSALGSWNASREKAAQQDRNREVERLLLGN